MKQYDAYLFDWDGTIARTLEMWLEVMRTIFTQFGKADITDDEIVQSFGNVKQKAFEYGIRTEDFEDFDRLLGDLSHAKVPYAAVYDGALDVLETLRNQRKKLALITTDWRRNVNVKLAHNNLNSSFDVVITGDEVSTHKPSPEGINRALAELGVHHEKAVMIGDSPHDVGAAKNAGIDSILFYPPSHELFYKLSTFDGDRPTYIVSDLRDIVAMEVEV